LRPLIGCAAWDCWRAFPDGEVAARVEVVLDRVKLPREHWRKRNGPVFQRDETTSQTGPGPHASTGVARADEPMNGLDPMGRQEVAHILKELAAEGVSILISSHILAELEALCKNILVLNWASSSRRARKKKSART